MMNVFWYLLMFVFVSMSLTGCLGVDATSVPGQAISAIATEEVAPVVNLDSEGRLPIIDGSQLINMQWTSFTTPNGVAMGGTGSDTPEGARAALGVGEVGTFSVLPVSNGGTGGTTPAEVRTSMGLGALATQDTVSVAQGGLGTTNIAEAQQVLGLGTSAQLNVGTAASNIVQLGSNGELPAIDGSQLVDLPTDIASFCCRLGLDINKPIVPGDRLATTIHLIPFRGNRIFLMSGGSWQLYQLSNAISVTFPTVADTNYDVFAKAIGSPASGTVVLELVAWSGNSRAEGVSRTDGVLVLTSDVTRRYLGTARTHEVPGEAADTEGQRFVWNYYNRVPRSLIKRESTPNWSYTTPVWRVANGNFNNRVEFVVGMRESFLRLGVATLSFNAIGACRNISISVDVPNSATSDSVGYAGLVGYVSMQGFLRHYPAVGYHAYYWVENSCPSGTTLFYGTGFGRLNGEIDG